MAAKGWRLSGISFASCGGRQDDPRRPRKCRSPTTYGVATGLRRWSSCLDISRHIVEPMPKGQVTSANDGRLRAKVPATCEIGGQGGCEGTFLPRRPGVFRRCPSCIGAGRHKCARCATVFTEERAGRGSKPLCPACRKGKVGPRGGRAARPVTRPRSERIRYDCRGVVIGRGQPQHADHCAGSSTLTAAQVKNRLAKANAPDARSGTSLDPTTRTYVCIACAGLRRVVDMARAACKNTTLPDDVLDELDHMGFIARPPRTLAEASAVNSLVAPHLGGTLKPLATIDGKARVANRVAKAAQRADRAARGVRSFANSERRGDRITAGKWRKGANIRVSLCAWPECGLLVFWNTSQKDPETHQARPTEMHQPCMAAAMRSPEGKRWLRVRKSDRDAGLEVHVVNRIHGAHLPVEGGRPTSETVAKRSDVLTRYLTWAVRHLLGEESQQALADEFGVKRSAVSQGLDRVLGLLPPDDLVPTYYRPLVDRLRRAVQRRRDG